MLKSLRSNFLVSIFTIFCAILIVGTFPGAVDAQLNPGLPGLGDEIKVQLLNGPAYDTDTPVIQFTVDPIGSAPSYSELNIMSVTSGLMQADPGLGGGLGDGPASILSGFEGDGIDINGNPTEVDALNAPYTITRKPEEPMDAGVYRLSLFLGEGMLGITPAVFSVTPAHFVDDINVALNGNLFLEGDISFSFTPYSRHFSSNYNYCLTTGVANGVPTVECEKAGNIEFGDTKNVSAKLGEGDGGLRQLDLGGGRIGDGDLGGGRLDQNPPEDWSDLPVGQYYLAIQDEFGAWKENPETIEVLGMMEASLSKNVFEVGTPMDLEINFSGMKAPYNVVFYNANNVGDPIDDFGVFENVSSPVSINHTPTEPGLYYAMVMTPDLVIRQYLRDISNSERLLFGIFEEGENLYLRDVIDQPVYTDSVYFDILGISKNSLTTHYCLIKEADLNPDGRSTDANCIEEGDYDIGGYASIFNNSLDPAVYYITLTDGVEWAKPMRFVVSEPINFTSTLSVLSDYQVGSAIAGVFNISGGIAPYSIEMHYASLGAYNSKIDKKFVVADNIYDNQYTLNFVPEFEGRYDFLVKDSVGEVTARGVGDPNDTWAINIFDPNKSLFVDFRHAPSEVIPVGDVPQQGSLDFYIFNKKGRIGAQEMNACITTPDNVNYTTGEVLNLGDCIRTSQVFGSTWGQQNTMHWTLPTTPQVLTLAINYISDGSWATPIEFVVDNLKAGFTVPGDDFIEIDSGENFFINTNIDCVKYDCEYFLHNSPSVSNLLFLHSLNNNSYNSETGIDSTPLPFGSYFIKAYANDNGRIVSSNVMALDVRDPNSSQFTVRLDRDKAVPFLDKAIAVNDRTLREARAATVVWKKSVSADVAEIGWNRLVSVKFTSDAEEVDVELQESFKKNGVVRKVSVETNLGRSVQLDDEVIVVIPLPSPFGALNSPAVVVVDGAGVSTEIDACEGLFVGNTGNMASATTPDNYNVPDNEACYVAGTGAMSNYLFIATRHLTDFIVGERGAADAGGNASDGTSSTTTGSKSSQNDSIIREISVDAVSDNLALENPLTSNNYFADLEGEASRHAVNTFKEMGVIEGYQDGLFKPHSVISRAEFVKVLVVLMNLEVNFTEDSGELFLDTHFGDWYYPYVRAAVENGFIAGADDGNFYPHTPLNVAEVATILYRVLEPQFAEISEEFEFLAGTELDSSAWYYEALRFANYYNILNSVDSSAPVTRGEAVIRLYNVYMR